jgi:uncharacterized Zn-binding protein involved in type VI secretion
VFPQARVDDHSQCAHGVGTIAKPCFPRVLSGGHESARLADRVVCPSPPDTLKQGSARVLIGGLPASRLRDQTFHAGVVITGSPNVLVGGGTVTATQLQNRKGPTNNFVAYDPETGRMYVVSYLEYHGPDATEAYAAAAKRQIEEMWSGQTTVDGRPVDVTVQVNTNVNPSGEPTPGYDRINVDQGVTRSNQTVGGGPGNQNPTDVGGNEAVAAHEYGHTLGIRDQYKDTPTGSVPDPTKTSNLKENIMAQTWPDAETGNPPHPYPEHYETVLERAGLRAGGGK